MTMENYKVISALGKGTYGSVYLVNDIRNNESYTLKKIECSNEATANRVINEVTQLNQQQYSFVLKYHEVFITWDMKNFSVFVCLVTEFLKRGNIGKLLVANKPLEMDSLKQLIGYLLDAFLCLHCNGITHRNIKPSNVFLRDDDTICLGDFGLMTLMNDPCVKKRLLETGCSMWLSPEAHETGYYEERSDVWSLGCLFLSIASCGGIISEEKLCVSLNCMKHSPESLDSILASIKSVRGNSFCSLIQTMVKNNVHHRPTILELCDNFFIIECLDFVCSKVVPNFIGKTDEQDVILVKLMKNKKCVGMQVSLLNELVELAQKQEGFALKPMMQSLIFEVLSKYNFHRNIQLLGLLTLYVAINREIAKESGDCMNFVDAAMSAIKEHSSDVELLIVAFQLLTELFLKDPKARSCIIESDQILTLFDAIKTTHGSLDLLIAFSILLMTLITDDHVSNVVIMCGVIQMMADILGLNLLNSDLVNAVLPIISYFSLSESNLTYLLAAGVPALLADIMDHYEEDATIVRFSAFILQSLCSIRDDCIYYIMEPVIPHHRRKGGLKSILNILQLHVYEPTIIDCIAKVLISVSCHEDIMHELSLLDVTTTLSLVLQQLHHDSEELKKNLQALLSKFLNP